MLHTRIGRVAAALAAAGGLSAAGLVAYTGTAGADYGAGTAYQIEISANAHFLITATGTKKVSAGAGIWLWFALTPNATTATGLSGTADYQGSDCQHNVAPGAPPGAVPDSGSTTYVVSGTTIEIGPMTLAGGGLPAVTVTVPSTVGHSAGSSFSSVFSSGVGPVTGLFHAIDGTVQVQVAP